jgi:hypothetical protein
LIATWLKLMIEMQQDERRAITAFEQQARAEILIAF